MRMTHVLSLSVALLILGTGVSTYADVGQFAVSGKIGTLGLGAEVTAGIAPSINARLGISGFSYSYAGTTDDIEYDYQLTLLSISGLVDWHPSGSGFRISGGLVLNQNEVTMEAEPSISYTIGDTTYALSDVGTLEGTIDLNDAAPYLGLGWGDAVGARRWGFAVDLGVVFQGTPSLDLSANGSLASEPTFMEDLEREEQDLQDDVDAFKYYPVIAVGVSYRF